MKQKDIRDIAAYWGAACRYEFECTSVEEWGAVGPSIVDFQTMRRLSEDRVIGLKLQLRPITSLTHEEEVTLAKLYGFEKIYYRRKLNDSLTLNALQIYWDQPWLFLELANDKNDNPYFDAVNNPGALIAYFQSIGVYVPGTIDERYVQLTA